MKFFTTLALIVFYLSSSIDQASAQEPDKSFTPINGYNITCTVKNLKSDWVVFSSIYGNSVKYIDSARVINGTFKFKSPSKLSRGLYRIFLDIENAMDIVVSEELIELKTDFNDIIGSMQVIQSRENRCLYYYYQKMAVLDEMHAELYNNTKIDEATRNIRTDSIIKAKNWFSTEIQRSFPFTFAQKLIAAYVIPERDFYGLGEVEKYKDRISFLRAHFFDNINFADSELLRSEVIYSSVQYYLDNLMEDKEDESYIKFIDMIMPKAGKNARMYDYILEILMKGFKTASKDVLYAYISEKYYIGSDHCDEADTSSSRRDVKDKIAFIKLTMVGANAPPLLLPDSAGKLCSLYGVKSKYTLLMFWHTHCIHCKQAMPEVAAQYVKYHEAGFDLFTVSIDSSQTEWMDVTRKLKAPWTQVFSAFGADKQLELYDVHSTPRFLLLDANKKIVARPKNAKELNATLSKEFGF
jgi:peroxiredoxin